MPLQAIKIRDFDTPLMRETIIDNELEKRIQALYQDDTRHHGYNTGEQAIEAFGQSFTKGGSLYVGMFNDKPICAIGCFVNTETGVHVLDDLAMHQQNLNRGIEEQFLKLICQNSQNKDGVDVSYTSNSSETLRIIEKLQKMIRK